MFAMTFQNNEALSHNNAGVGLRVQLTQRDHKNHINKIICWACHSTAIPVDVFADDFYEGKPIKQIQQLKGKKRNTWLYNDLNQSTDSF